MARYPDTVETHVRRRTLNKQLTAVIKREGDGDDSLCPELDIAIQGASVEEARQNLQEVLEFFIETAPAEEVWRWLSTTYTCIHGDSDPA